MSKIAILLCAMVVASLDASANDQLEDVENEIKSNIDGGLRALKEEIDSMWDTFVITLEKLNSKYIPMLGNITEDFYSYAEQTMRQVSEVKANVSSNCLFNRNCTQAITQAEENFWESHLSRQECVVTTAFKLTDNELTEPITQYNKAKSFLTELKEKPLCSSQYNKTTQLEAITSCNEELRKQVNEELNKLPPVLAQMKNAKKFLTNLPNEYSDCWNLFNLTTFHTEMDEGVKKAETCYKQCQLEEQLQTSTAAN